uniref:hypothetical protein n=1 Tax=Pseudopedobacter sp. TaxID=1936787 RepID=UPI0033402726
NTQLLENILQECFHDFSLEETKAYLWQLFSLTVSGGFNRQPLERRENILAFYEHLQKVLDVLEPILTEGELNSQMKKELNCRCIIKSPE